MKNFIRITIFTYLHFQNLFCFSQNNTIIEEHYDLLNLALESKYIFIGECHNIPANVSSELEIVSYYVAKGYNNIALERGYAECYLLNEYLHNKDKHLYRFVSRSDFGTEITLIRELLDVCAKDQSVNIIGIDYEHDYRFTVKVFNEIFYKSNLVRDCEDFLSNDTAKTPFPVFIDYDIPKQFRNDTIKYYYDMINGDKEDVLEVIDSMYNVMKSDETKYRELFGSYFEVIIRCINALKMNDLIQCKYFNDVSCVHLRENFLFENFKNYIVVDSLKTIGIFGFIHTTKEELPVSGNVGNFKSFVSRLNDEKFPVMSFLLTYIGPRFMNFYCKENDIGINAQRYNLLRSIRKKGKLVIFKQPDDSDWFDNKRYFDLLIITDMYN